ncbi:MAG: hypothetical protein LLF89_10000 [Spirochaetaceae bacterium]|nr:hypothetical protein [Spirochaetaceae bacterium]
MFENLLAQDEAKTALTRDLESHKVPPVLLFAGPPASGKMTAAMETARVLSCRQTGTWNCSCPDCAHHRSLLHADLLLFGKRTYPEEILAARDLVLRSPGKSSAYFFIRSVRKLLARFNPVLWEGEEAKLAKAVPLLQAIEEELGLLEPESLPGRELQESTTKAVEALYSDCSSLEAYLPEFPSVSMIRNMETWAQLAPVGKRKTVIIENADRMQDSARNAMLKILEEPPDTVRFILLTSRRASMISTIVSRSRVYAFRPRDAAATKLIIKRVFKSDESAVTLQDYFDGKKPFPGSQARDYAELMTGLLLSSQGRDESRIHSARVLDMIRRARDSGLSMPELLEKLAAQTGNFGAKNKSFSGSFIQFLKALLSTFSELLAASAEDPWLFSVADRWSGLARETATQSITFNRSPEMLLKVLVDSCGEY